MKKAAILVASASVAAEAKWVFQDTSFVAADSESMHGIDLCGNRGTTALIAAGTDRGVRVSYPNRNEGAASYATAYLAPNDGTLPNYAYSAACVGDDAMGKVIFATRSGTSSRGTFVYRGAWSAWSQSQYLQPLSDFADNSYGDSVVVDHKSRRLAAVTCPDCLDKNGDSFGQIYIYEPTSPSAEQWSQSQVLELPFETHTASYKLGDAIQLHDKILLATSTNDAGDDFVNIFERTPSGAFTLQQSLISSSTMFATNGEQIVLADSTASVNTGVAIVLEPFRGVPGKPVPAKWSSVQTLTNDVFFGLSLAFGNDGTLGVTSTNQVNFFSKHSSPNSWSLNQVLATPTTNIGESESVGYNGNLVGKNSPTSESVILLNNTASIRCLQVTVADSFGDGWDGAVLRVEAPDGSFNEYAPNCGMISDDDDDHQEIDTQLYNLQFLYCPTTAEDAGLYKFRMVGAETAKYPWEISWAVRNEYGEDVLFGDKDTAMDFAFEPDKLRFVPKAITKNVVSRDKGTRGENDFKDACIPCKTTAPNAGIDGDDVRWIHVNHNGYVTSPSAVFLQDEPFVRISDRPGHRDIWSTAFCSAADENDANLQTCWMDIPDGNYTLRVATAGFSEYVTSFEASICGVDVLEEEQFEFGIFDGKCKVYGPPVYTFDLCSTYDVIVHGLSTVYLSGVSVSSKEDLSSADIALLEDSMKHAISGHTAVEAHLVEFVGSVAIVKLGYAASDFNAAPGLDTNTDAFFEFQSTLNSMAVSSKSSNRVFASLSSNASPVFHGLQTVNIESMELTSAKAFDSAASSVDLVANVEIGQQVVLEASSTEEKSASTFSVSSVGYVLAGMAGVAAALFAITRFAPVTKKTEALPSSLDTSNSA